MYSQPRLVNSDSEEEEDVEDEDSNDENNWRNDYPEDEELSDNESIGERQMRRAMNNFKIENELSSDYEEDNVGYTPESYTFDYEDDADRYGEAYADFKKRVLRDSADSSIAESNESRYDTDYQPGMNTSFNSFIDSDWAFLISWNPIFKHLSKWNGNFSFIFFVFAFSTPSQKFSFSIYCHF